MHTRALSLKRALAKRLPCLLASTGAVIFVCGLVWGFVSFLARHP